MRWTIVTEQEEFEAAMEETRGSYQRDFLRGFENLSGSTLSGKAKKYRGHYAESRRNLLARLTAAGICWGEVRGTHNKRLLVIGPSADMEEPVDY